MVTEDFFDKQFQYYSAWLDIQNNQQAHDLVKGIHKNKGKDLEVFMMLNSDRFRSNGSRFYIRQLSEAA